MNYSELYDKGKKFKPIGPYAALATPFKQDGSVNYSVLSKEVEFLVEKKVSGLFPCGSTGEFIHLNMGDNHRVIKEVVRQAGGRVPVVPGSCASNIDDAVEHAQYAAQLGCPAVVICPPYYIRLSQDAILKYYRTIARAVDVGIVLYNIPAFTDEISFCTFQRLVEEDNIIGIKDSSGNLKTIMHFIQYVQSKRPGFAIMTGTDDIIFPALAGGCVGSMTALAGIVPEVITQLYTAHHNEDYDTALRLQLSIVELTQLAESISFPAGYKLILERRGFDMGRSKQVIAEEGTLDYIQLKNVIDLQLKGLLEDDVKVPTMKHYGRPLPH